MRKFKDGEIAVLIATDLAARGLDIEHVKTVGDSDFVILPTDIWHIKSCIMIIIIVFMFTLFVPSVL